MLKEKLGKALCIASALTLLMGTAAYANTYTSDGSATIPVAGSLSKMPKREK